jgi:hypothetical protein
VLVVLALCAGTSDAVLYLCTAGRSPTLAAFADGNRSLADLLARRAAAVTKHDEAAFLADVDPADPRFVARQRTEFQNLVALGLSSFSLTLTDPGGYQLAGDSPLRSRYGGLVREVGVTVKYAVSGVDTVPDAEPWIPTFGFAGGRWLLAGEEGSGATHGLPFGIGGQPWEARPITVVRAAHIVAVISKEDAEIAQHLVDLGERGIAGVLKVCKTGWPEKVLVTAVSDQKVFSSYFESSPDKLAQIEAVTIPRYDEVPEWSSEAHIVLSRVVFNPATLGRGDDELQHTLTHEFTHVALGLVTSEATPRWLVEGAAEYVAYASDSGSDATAARLARHVSATALPDDATFYDSADNYVLGWLAVKLIVQRYGQAELLALYDYFKEHTGTDAGLQAVLGIGLGDFTAAWLAYLKQLTTE